jgi:hypothetical protein
MLYYDLELCSHVSYRQKCLEMGQKSAYIPVPVVAKICIHDKPLCVSFTFLELSLLGNG